MDLGGAKCEGDSGKSTRKFAGPGVSAAQGRSFSESLNRERSGSGRSPPRDRRSGYQAASRNRILQQELFDAEQKRFAAGISTPYNVIVQQRDLAAANSAEIAAKVAYSNARIALDQTLGATLEANHVSIDEAVRGQVSRKSTIPTQP